MRLLFSALGVFMMVCVAIGGGFFFIGQRAPVTYTTTQTIRIDADAAVVWAALTNVSTLVERYDDINAVELLAVDAMGATRWKVQRGETSVMVYRRAQARPNQFLSIQIDEGGNMGIEGGYEYVLNALDDGRTQLVATETTKVEDIVLRAAFALAGGRDQPLRAQLDEIKAISELQ